MRDGENLVNAGNETAPSLVRVGMHMGRGAGGGGSGGGAKAKGVNDLLLEHEKVFGTHSLSLK